MLAALAAIAIVGCQSEDVSSDLELVDTTISQEETARNAQVDLATESVDNIVESVYFNDEVESLSDTGRSNNTIDFLPDCVTITTVVTSTSKEKTIDFGDGCELPNGNVLSGIIKMSYEKDMEAASKTISVSFENFYFNAVQVEGSMSRLRQRANDAGNPQSTINVDVKVTWPDETFASKVGTKIREWIEGVGTGQWGDNVYLITGNWTTTFRNGNVHAGEVVVPLRRELACLFLVSGVIDLQRNNASGSLDFGDGSCDNIAILTTANGEEITIYL